MFTEIAGILPDEFTDKSQRDVLLVVREPGCDGPQLYQVLVTYPAYMPLYYMLLFLYSKYRWHYELYLRDTRQTC
jgi:hypothetical protein